MATSDWQRVVGGLSASRTRVTHASLSDPITQHGTYCLQWPRGSGHDVYLIDLGNNPTMYTDEFQTTRGLFRSTAQASGGHFFVCTRYVSGAAPRYILKPTGGYLSLYYKNVWAPVTLEYFARSAFTWVSDRWYAVRLDTWREGNTVVNEAFICDTDDVDTVGGAPDYEIPWQSQFKVGRSQANSNSRVYSGSPQLNAGHTGGVPAYVGKTGWGVSAIGSGGGYHNAAGMRGAKTESL